MRLSWKKILEVLEGARSELGEVSPPVDPGEAGGWTARLPFAELVAASDAVRELVRAGEWPAAMSESVRAQIALRLDVAVDFASFGRKGAFAQVAGASHTGRPPFDDLPHAVEHLMIDLWYNAGLGWVTDRWPLE